MREVGEHHVAGVVEMEVEVYLGRQAAKSQSAFATDRIRPRRLAVAIMRARRPQTYMGR
ncbi:hypothetical protein X736_24665 [Mesorhizobium sp. L2C089B000]|nr:hypothetical protein X736_24665 [Mesorhizobium sp. L2C089B000]